MPSCRILRYAAPFAIALAGCSEPPTTSIDKPPASARAQKAPTSPANSHGKTGAEVPRPQLNPLPALRRDVAKVATTSELSTLARVLVPTVTPTDGITVLVAWRDSEGHGFSAEHALANKKVNWLSSLSDFTVEVAKQGGHNRVLRVEKREPLNRRVGKSETLQERSSQALRIDDDGIRIVDTMVTDVANHHVLKWAAPTQSIFAGPGKYTVKLTGVLVLDEQTISYTTGELAVEVRAAGTKFWTLTAIEAQAARLAAPLKKFDKLLSIAKSTLEDVQGSRVVRFRLGNRLRAHFVELVVTPNGQLLSKSEEVIRGCIAEGTLVETPGGQVRIETLQEGGLLWAYDPSTGERVRARIERVLASETNQLVRIGPMLSTSRNHPIYADGRWLPAGLLVPGSELLRFDLAAQSLSQVTTVEGRARVYDLMVEFPHTFFAGGLLVHNKRIARKQWKRQKFNSLFGDTWDTVDYRPKALKSTSR